MREFEIYWLALALTVARAGPIVALLRSRHGLALTAIRDNELAAQSNGIDVTRIKFIVYVLTGFGTAMVGALIFLQKLRISPDAAFSVNDWTAFVIFITVIGGIGRIEGPIIGTIVFFVLRQTLADLGSLYLLMMGAVAIVVMLWAPKGLWGLIAERFGWQVLPLQRRLVLEKETGGHHEHDHRHLLPHLSGPFFPGNEQGRAEPQQYRQAAARHQKTVRSRRAFQGNGRSSAITGRSSRCPIRRSRTSPSRDVGLATCAHRQRFDGRVVPQISRTLSGLRRRAVPDRRRGLGGGGAPRRQGSRRPRRAALHQHRRPPARRAGVRADLRHHGRARSADLAASGRHRGDAGLSGREEIALRDVVVLPLALRDLGGHGAHGVLRPARPLSQTQDHHPPSSAA